MSAVNVKKKKIRDGWSHYYVIEIHTNGLYEDEDTQIIFRYGLQSDIALPPEIVL